MHFLTSPIDNPRSCEMGCAVARSEVAPPVLFVPISGVCKKVVTSGNVSSCSKFSRLAGTHLTRELGYKGMTDENLNLTTLHHTCIEPSPSNNKDVQRHWHGVVKRRSFLRSIGNAGTALSASVLLGSQSHAQTSRRSSLKLPKGDAALLRLAAAFDLIEADPVQVRECD